MAQELITKDQIIYKEKADKYQKAIKLMFKALLKKTPRGIIIEVLKEEKIIKRDWCAKNEEYEEKWKIITNAHTEIITVAHIKTGN